MSDRAALRRGRLANSFQLRLQEALIPFSKGGPYPQGVHHLFRYQTDDGLVHWRRLEIADGHRQLICKSADAPYTVVGDDEPVTCMECLGT